MYDKWKLFVKFTHLIFGKFARTDDLLSSWTACCEQLDRAEGRPVDLQVSSPADN